MHFQVWSILALIALVLVISSTAKSAINPDAIDKVDVNEIGPIGNFEKSGHCIQKREDESEEPEEPEEEPTTPKPKKKKKKTTPHPGGVVIVNKIVNKVPKGERHGKQNHEHYNEQPAPVAAQPAEQEGKGFWPFLKNVAQIVNVGVGVAGLFVG